MLYRTRWILKRTPALSQRALTLTLALTSVIYNVDLRSIRSLKSQSKFDSAGKSRRARIDEQLASAGGPVGRAAYTKGHMMDAAADEVASGEDHVAVRRIFVFYARHKYDRLGSKVVGTCNETGQGARGHAWICRR